MIGSANQYERYHLGSKFPNLIWKTACYKKTSQAVRVPVSLQRKESQRERNRLAPQNNVKNLAKEENTPIVEVATAVSIEPQG